MPSNLCFVRTPTVIRRIAVTFALLMLGAPALAAAPPATTPRPDKPNIILIFIDDMGYADVSCFGNTQVRTPHIDSLATGGLRLTNFYVNSPICSPSRVAITTGQYPGRWKIHSYLESRARNRERGMADWLDPKAPSIGRIFKQAGYATAHFGKWHMGGGRDVDDAPGPATYGFDEHLLNFEGIGNKVKPPRHTFTAQYVDHAVDFARRHRDQPFLIRLFPNDVHDPHAPAPGAIDKWKAVTENPFEQKFFAVLEEMDRQIGRVIEEIDDLGLTERTIFIFTSDNGPTDWPSYYQKGWSPPGSTGPYFGRKWSLYEGGIRMPFIVQWKGVIPAGNTDDRNMVAAIDLLPTLCKLADVAPPPPDEIKFDGEDRSAILLGRGIDKTFERSQPLFWQYGPPHARLKPGKPEFISPSFAIRDGRWKLLVNPDGSDLQLYDLEADPGEKTNLAKMEAEKARVLWEKVRVWAGEIGYEMK